MVLLFSLVEGVSSQADRAQAHELVRSLIEFSQEGNNSISCKSVIRNIEKFNLSILIDK